MPAAELSIDVFKTAGTRYHSHLHRPDGVIIKLEGGSWNTIGGRPGRVPHDLAHLVVERELGLKRGLWGVLAAGGLVQNAAFESGRRPPHAERHARAVSAAAGEQLRQAEVLVRAAADASREGSRDVDAIRRAITARWWSDALTRDALERIDAELQAWALQWQDLPAGAAFTIRWTPR